LGLITYFGLSRLADSPRRILAVIVCMSAGIALGTLVIVRGLVSISGLQMLSLASGARFGGIRGDPNVQAAYTNCCVPVILYLLALSRRWARAGVAVLLLFLIATVVLSQSRAGMLLLALLLAGWLLHARRARGYALVGILALTVVAFLLPPVYWVRFQSIAQFRGIVVDRSLQLRQHALEGHWHVFLDHPWFGVGLGNVGDNAPRFMLGTFVAHNSFLEIAAGLGIAGGLAYVALLWSGWRMARRAAVLWGRLGRRAERELAGSLALAVLAFALSAMTLSISFYIMLWVLFGLANAARRAAEQDAVARALGAAGSRS
jgi:O-antigen ligase